MKKSKHDLGWYIAFGVLTFLFILVAPAVPVAKAVVGSIFSVRLSTYNKLDSSLESDTYKFRKDYPTMGSRETVSFFSGDNLLKGYLYQNPSSDSLIVMSHGMDSMADGKESAYEDYFIEKGWNVLAIDLTASGQSEGKGAGGLDQSAFDVEAALKYVHLSSSLKSMNLFLLGYSWGAYGVVASLNFDQTPKAVASLAGFRSPDLEMVDKAVRYVGPSAYATKGFMDQALYLSRGNNGFLSAIDGINKATNTKIFIAQGGKDKTVTPFSSIYAARAQISDQSRVSLYYAPERSHENLFFSEAASSYMEATVKPLMSSMKNRYPDWSLAPASAKESYRNQIDKNKTSELDSALLSQIESLFSSSLN